LSRRRDKPRVAAIIHCSWKLSPIWRNIFSDLRVHRYYPRGLIGRALESR
jgi:hypothetical protein